MRGSTGRGKPSGWYPNFGIANSKSAAFLEFTTPNRRCIICLMLQIKRNIVFPDNSFFLFGPRGTGKSTLLKARYPQAIYIDFLLASEFLKYNNSPDRLVDLVSANPDKNVIILDEVQRIPEILSVVHHLIEKHKRLRFILTGSSTRKLKKEGTNLLGGRAILKRMHPFTALEIGSKFSLEQSLDHGLIPVVYVANNKLQQIDAYLNLYLREEIQQEGLTRNISYFSRFLESISFSQASLLNISNIAKDCGIERKVVEAYIGILEDLLLSTRLTVFPKKAKRALAHHPKFYFFDVGIYKAIRPKGPLDKPEEINGAGLEGLVLQNIIAYLDNIDTNTQVYFWRTKAGLEIDFIIYGGNTFTAIEVKNSASINSKDLTAFKSFGEDYPQSKQICLYRGKEKIYRGKVLLVPAEEFLLNIKEYL